jgi:hypothetical protein
MASPTWADITTTWDVETRTWQDLLNYVTRPTDEYMLTFTLEDIVNDLTWTPQIAITGNWTPESEL